jgi:hypothetical protein
VLRRMTGDFREPVVWLLLAIVVPRHHRNRRLRAARPGPHQAQPRRSRRRAGLSLSYGRLGQHVPSPDQGQVKRPDNYVARILATIFTFGIYLFWWFYNQMDEPNKHFTGNWAQEDHLVNAVDALG